MDSERNKKFAASSSSVLLVLLCFSTVISPTSQAWNYRHTKHDTDFQHKKLTDHVSKKEQVQGHTSGSEDNIHDNGFVIIEEPDNKPDYMIADSVGATRGSKRGPDPSRFENIVSPWEPPLFEWIYNPALQERHEKYYEQQGGQRNDHSAAARRSGPRSQAFTSSAARNTFPGRQNYPGRLNNHPRKLRPLNRRRQPLARTQDAGNLAPRRDELRTAPQQFRTRHQAQHGEPGILPPQRPTNALPYQQQTPDFAGGFAARHSTDSHRASGGFPPNQTLEGGSFTTRQNHAQNAYSRRVKFPQRTQVSQYKNSLNQTSSSPDGEHSSLASAHSNLPTAHSRQYPSSRGQQNIHSAHGDDATCREQLEHCRRSQDKQSIYQENLRSLKEMIVEVFDRLIQNPNLPLEGTMCDAIRRHQPTSAHSRTTQTDVRKGSHSDITDIDTERARSRAAGPPRSPVSVDDVTHVLRGHSTDGSVHPGGGVDSGEYAKTLQLSRHGDADRNNLHIDNTRRNIETGQGSTLTGLGGREGGDLDHQLSLSRRHQTKDLGESQGRQLSRTPDTRGSREQILTPFSPTASSTRQSGGRREAKGVNKPSGPDNLILTDTGSTALPPENESGAGSRGHDSGDGSGTGVHFDDLDEPEERYSEREKIQQQFWETWRQSQEENIDISQENTQDPRPDKTETDCSLGAWTEWSSPVGFGVIERRRSVMDNRPDCKQAAKKADLVMRVDIAVFNSNHTYYKPPEQVGQDFETDFTRSYVPRDLLLVIDASGSIESEEFEQIRQGVAAMVDLFCGGFGEGPTNNRLAIIIFASEIKIIHRFSDDQSPDTLRAVITNMTQPNGNTCTGDALKLAHDVIFTPENGARKDVVHDTLLLTDGHSNCGEVTVQQGAQLLQSVSNVFALGVGIANDTEARWELNSVVSNNEPRHIFSLERYEDFMDMTRSIQERQKTVPCLPIVDAKMKPVN